MKASILGIGTELTSGQIANGNAQWISAKLKASGVMTHVHMVVPDEKALILNALKACSEQSDLIFVTGGLGPTSDDFTREMIAEFCGLELMYDAGSWAHLSERLNSRGIIVREMQKQQCYFPKGSQILTNRNGTANGFSLRWNKKIFFVLPGPPREIEVIWEDYLLPELKTLAQNLDPHLTKYWDCLGIGESEVAHLVAEGIKDCPFEIAYRVHMPYVEFKISYLKSQSHEAEKYISYIDEKLTPVCVSKDGRDVVENLSEQLKRFSSVLIVDDVSKGFLLQRLMPFAKKLLAEQKLSYTTKPIALEKDQFELVLNLQFEGPETCCVAIEHRGQKYKTPIESVYKNRMLMSERAFQYYAERAMIFWLMILNR